MDKQTLYLILVMAVFGLYVSVLFWLIESDR